MMLCRFWPSLVIAAVVTAAMVGPAAAQGAHPESQNPAGALGERNKNQPVQIDAATLEVHDKSKTATFSGNVRVVQGDTTMKCQTLVVFYGQEIGIAEDKEAATSPAGPKPAPLTSAQNIRRIEAHGGVTVVSKDQNATGDLGVYDLASKTITLTGNVVVSQGANVIHGERVVVDTTTGNARVESSTAGAAPSRVRALIVPNSGQNGGPANVMTIGPGRTN
jgi:lipopolysaccharide export system protein LptA